MSRKNPTPDETGISLDALQSRSERLGEWIGANPTPILGTLGALLVGALVLGVVQSSRQDSAREAAEALARVQRTYRSAMGAEPGSFEIAEPANAAAALAAREQAVVGFEGVIDEYDGSVTAALAALEQGELLVELGRSGDAVVAWEAAAQGAQGALRGLLLERIGAAAEIDGDLGAAAAAYERAGAIANYPLRYDALAEAAHLRARAGEAELAVALLQQLETEAPGFLLPDHIDWELREIRALQAR